MKVEVAVPNKPNGFTGRKATLKLTATIRRELIYSAVPVSGLWITADVRQVFTTLIPLRLKKSIRRIHCWHLARFLNSAVSDHPLDWLNSRVRTDNVAMALYVN